MEDQSVRTYVHEDYKLIGKELRTYIFFHCRLFHVAFTSLDVCVVTGGSSHWRAAGAQTIHAYLLVSLKLYDTALVIANPFAHAEYREELVKERLEKLSENVQR